MTLNELRDKIHENAVKHGFYQAENEIDQIGVDNRTAIKHAFFAQKIALIISEASEALEADRKNRRADLNEFERLLASCAEEAELSEEDAFKYAYNCAIKGTVEEEIADSVIRNLDLCGSEKINIQRHVELKMRYNELREYKHGKAY